VDRVSRALRALLAPLTDPPAFQLPIPPSLNSRSFPRSKCPSSNPSSSLGSSDPTFETINKSNPTRREGRSSCSGDFDSPSGRKGEGMKRVERLSLSLFLLSQSLSRRFLPPHSTRQPLQLFLRPPHSSPCDGFRRVLLRCSDSPSSSGSPSPASGERPPLRMRHPDLGEALDLSDDEKRGVSSDEGDTTTADDGTCTSESALIALLSSLAPSRIFSRSFFPLLVVTTASRNRDSN
jgi:hypothetical protein